MTIVGFVIPRCEKSADVLLLLPLELQVGEARCWGLKLASVAFKSLSVPMGVNGESGSIIEVSSSNKETVSSFRNVWDFSVAKLFSTAWSLDDRFGGLFSLSASVTPSIEGKPNSMASSNFWGEAR